MINGFTFEKNGIFTGNKAYKQMPSLPYLQMALEILGSKQDQILLLIVPQTGLILEIFVWKMRRRQDNTCSLIVLLVKPVGFY